MRDAKPAAVALAVLAVALTGCRTRGHATLVVLPAESFCMAKPASAQIVFVVAIRNTGNATGTTSARPWRRYDDGSINDGFSDITATFDIQAGDEQTIETSVPFEPADHAPRACRVYLGAEYYAIPLAR